MSLKEKLRAEVLETHWPPLAEHFARGVLYYLEPELDIIEIAQAMASDDVTRIKNCLDDGLLYPPTPEQATAFAKKSEPSSLFLMIIIEPYVLIQEKETS